MHPYLNLKDIRIININNSKIGNNIYNLHNEPTTTIEELE